MNSTDLTFKHVNKIVRCPDCGCTRIKRANIHGKHTNGEQFESIEFECGFSREYVPNFSRYEDVTDCRLSAKYSSERLATQTLASQLIALIRSIKTINPNRLAALKENITRWKDGYR